MQGWRPITIIKRDINSGVFPWILQNFQEPILRNICKLLFLFQSIYKRLELKTRSWSETYLGLYQTYIRSSDGRRSVKKGVFKSFAKFSGKHLCWSLFFTKVVGLSPETLLKMRLQHRCFPVNFSKFSRPPFLHNTSGISYCYLIANMLSWEFMTCSKLRNFQPLASENVIYSWNFAARFIYTKMYFTPIPNTSIPI